MYLPFVASQYVLVTRIHMVYWLGSILTVFIIFGIFLCHWGQEILIGS